LNKINKEFSKHAKEYNSYNIIQQIVSKALVRELDFEPKRILELGCGSGQVFKNIDFDFEYYKAIDFSSSMCEIHPKQENLEVLCLDFDSQEFIDSIKDNSYDIVLSSSALQWSQNLSLILKTLKDISKNIQMVLFTSNTFKTIFDITQTKSPILSSKSIKNSFNKYYDCHYEILNYKLEFENKKKLFDYIKNSGVSGGKKLSFSEAKKLYQNYTLDYLEFEVVFVKGCSGCSISN
jgi:malonyl-CoA O-methyltransferase